MTSYGRGDESSRCCFENRNRNSKYYNCPRCPCGQCTRKRLRRAHAVGLSSSRTLVGNSSCEVIKLAVSSMKLTKRVAGFIVFLISSMVLPWALKTLKSKSHVAMRANEPAILLTEAMGHWQFRCLRPVNLQSFTCRRKIVSIHFSDLLLNSTPHAAGGKRARNAPDAGGARCAHAANRYTP